MTCQQGRCPTLQEQDSGLMTLRKPRSWHLELGEVSGRFPVFVIPDSGASRKSDGDPISSVCLRSGEFCPCDLPHSSFLSGIKQVDRVSLARKELSNRQKQCKAFEGTEALTSSQEACASYGSL